jgi:hypothetical protein
MKSLSFATIFLSSYGRLPEKCLSSSCLIHKYLGRDKMGTVSPGQLLQPVYYDLRTHRIHVMKGSSPERRKAQA